MSANPRSPRAPLAGAVLFFSVFGLYLFTLAPTVTFWDSGELIAAAYSLGIPHQPGYPLYCMLGRLFSFIPFGNIAYRANLLSAVLAATAVYVVYKTLLSIFRRQDGGAGEAGLSDAVLAGSLACLVAVTRLYWSEAVVAEVYAGAALFVALSIYLYVLSLDGSLSPARYIALTGLLFGLGVVNHMSHVLYLPALLITWGIVRGADGGGSRPARFAAGVFFMLLGMSAYLYLPLRSAAGPALDIGHPDTWANFAWVVKWGEYVKGAVWLIGHAQELATKAAGSGPRVLAGITASAALCWMAVKEDKRLYAPLVVFIVVYTSVISAQVLESERDIRLGLPAKFFIPTLVAGMVVVGGYARPLFGAVRSRFAKPAATSMVIAAVLSMGARNYYPDDYSKNYIAFDYAENSLKSAGERGVLLTWGDNGVFPLWYLRLVERYRDDTVLVHTPLLTYGWYLADVERMLGMKAGFMEGYFLGENVYRLVKAVTPARTFAYDYSATVFLKLNMKELKVRGLVYFEGDAPSGNPWPYYVMRGVEDPDVFKGEMDKNIAEIYRYQARVSDALPPPAFTDRP